MEIEAPQDLGSH